MYQLFFTPNWFNGLDIFFEGISLIVALLIAAYSLRIYRFTKENRFAYFMVAFLMVAFGLASKMFTSSVLYYHPLREVTAGVLSPIVGPGLEFADLFYRAGFFVEMFLMLAAWLLIFFISQKSRDRLRKYHEVSQMALFIYLIFLISFVANFQYVVFYLTSAVILGLTVLNYYKNYLNTDKNENAFRVMLSFIFILLSNVFFVFVYFYNQFYVLAEIFMLIGFLTLLGTYSKIKRRF
ncbi:hypothetical protein COY27_00185 [Candidatus Woesearchaeota archaeon CG_4_10_14_0_2_um_filter_33_13]|nr:MAG: hypothetical protein COY27_00185 [Candidatus Woesearchaeota archaeon CG_4_10_14_0_2_um_filter_33_13]